MWEDFIKTCLADCTPITIARAQVFFYSGAIAYIIAVQRIIEKHGGDLMFSSNEINLINDEIRSLLFDPRTPHWGNQPVSGLIVH